MYIWYIIGNVGYNLMKVGYIYLMYHGIQLEISCIAFAMNMCYITC